MNTTRYLNFLTLTCLAVFAFYSTSTIACSCIGGSPQYFYCNSNYVVVVRVLRKSTDPVEEQVAYKVEIIKSYKMTPEGQNALRNGRLVTSSFGSLCGVELKLDKLYVIAGRQSVIGLCDDYVKEYERTSIAERERFSGFYNKDCSSENKGPGNYNPHFKDHDLDAEICTPDTFRVIRCCI